MDGEDRGASEHESGDDWGEDLEGDGLRGWIPPDDRLWRHPSESPSPESGGQPRPTAPGSPTRDRSGPWLVGGATACVIVALVAAGLVMTTTTSSDGGSANNVPRLASLTVPTTEPGVGPVAPSPTVASMVEAIRPSTVALLIDTATGTVLGTGLVAEAGGIIVTTSRAVPSSRSVTVVEEDGHRVDATRVGTDPTSGTSVLTIGDDLPPARWDLSGPSRGSTALAMALEPSQRSGQPPTPVVYAGKVVATGVALGLDPVSSTFAVLGVEAPVSSSDIGCPLLDTAGQVVGVLDRVGGSGLDRASTFLPAELVWGVADELITAGSVDPGSMGITAANAVSPGNPQTPAGAIVSSVAPGGPAAQAGIEDGDVVTGIGGYPVRSRAELDTRLYTDPGGSDVAVTIDRGDTTFTRQVDLTDADGAADPDAPERPPSP